MLAPLSTSRAFRARARHARTAVLWGLGAAIGLQLAFALVADLFFPAAYDPEFYLRLGLLRAQLRERPGRPLALLIGSSRTVGSFRPEILPSLHAGDGRDVLVFNDSHIANDPISLMLEYRRVRQAGIRPDFLIVEVLPAALKSPEPHLAANVATINEAPTLWRYYNPLQLGWLYGRPRLNWCRNFGHELLATAVPALAEPGRPSNWDRQSLGPLGGSIFPGPGLRASATPEESRQFTEDAKKTYARLLGQFALADNQVRAIDAILSVAGKDGTATVLITTPESSEFRGWYSAAAEAQLADFMKERHDRHGVSIVDARCWLPDEEFIDGHHVFLAGADHFTRLLAQRVIEPLVRGSPMSADGAP